MYVRVTRTKHLLTDAKIKWPQRNKKKKQTNETQAKCVFYMWLNQIILGF